MEKWMVVLVAAGFLIPYGTVLAVTGNIHGAEYVRQQEKEAAGKYRILLDREENGGTCRWKNTCHRYWQLRSRRTVKWKRSKPRQ